MQLLVEVLNLPFMYFPLGKLKEAFVPAINNPRPQDFQLMYSYNSHPSSSDLQHGSDPLSEPSIRPAVDYPGSLVPSHHIGRLRNFLSYHTIAAIPVMPCLDNQRLVSAIDRWPCARC
jgi:hypothetical protein